MNYSSNFSIHLEVFERLGRETLKITHLTDEDTEALKGQ